MAAGAKRARKSAGEAFGLAKNFEPINRFKSEAQAFHQILLKLFGSPCLRFSEQHIQNFHAAKCRDSHHFFIVCEISANRPSLHWLGQRIVEADHEAGISAESHSRSLRRFSRSRRRRRSCSKAATNPPPLLLCFL